MDLNQEQAKTLITKISNIDSTISEFWELYNDALAKSQEQMELNGETHKHIELIASKIQIIENHTKQQTDHDNKELRFLEQLITNQKKEENHAKETKEIFKSSFATLNMNIKALRQSFDSDREESGLLKDEPNKGLEKVLGKLNDKLDQLLKQNGNIKNIKVEKDKNEEDGFFMSLLKGIAVAGIGLAAIGFLWGLIKDNPAVQKFLEEAGKIWDNVWKEYIQPAMDAAWNIMIDGLKDLGNKAWELIKKHWDIALGVVGVAAAGLAIKIAGLGALFGTFGIAAAAAVAAIGAATVAAGLILYDLNKAGKEAQAHTEKAWGTNDDMAVRNVKKLEESDIPEDEKQLRIKKEKIQQQLANIDISQLSMQKELDNWAFGGGSFLGIGGNKDQIREEYNKMNKLKIKLIEEQKKIDAELKKQKDKEAKVEEIKKEYEPVVPPKNILDPSNIDQTPGKHLYRPDELPIQLDKKLSTLDNNAQKGPLVKENTISNYTDANKENPVMVNYLANIHKSLEELNAKLDQNTEVNLQGHIANAQATLQSVPPPPVINIPKDKLSPNSTRHLANVYTDPDYRLT